MTLVRVVDAWANCNAGFRGFVAERVVAEGATPGTEEALASIREASRPQLVESVYPCGIRISILGIPLAKIRSGPDMFCLRD